HVLTSLPAPGEVVTFILRGDFVLGDMLPPLCAPHSPVDELWVTTLALSHANAVTLRRLVTSGTVRRAHLVCSHYFRAVDK
ncbi:hypothetical protein, partial [Streptococcus pneumoniae]|uniref:hypothetical protein n=1 Tax=Streptococcus pneumoniae TaxID=1313 RepID=UPI001E5C9C12